MNDKPRPSLSELLADHALISDAIGRAVREAVIMHAKAGRPVATWREGKVVWIPAEEILRSVAASELKR
jgi:hypothetical protein